MSEYQYYEFVAVDRPLDARELAELRGVSTRARITPTSFVNTYEWGDLRADPRRLMERYFDAFLYLTNSGTHRLMLRFPVALLDVDAARRYCVGDAASAWQVDDQVIVDLVAEDEDGTYEEDWVNGGEGRLAAIVPARAELAAGDRRLLYLAWLVCVQAGEVPDDDLEPLVPANLGQLSASLHSVAAFLRIDEDLLAAAASASAHQGVEAGSVSELGHWLATLPSTEKDGLLLRVLQGDGPLVQAELRARFPPAAAFAAAREHGDRTVEELISLADARREDRRELARQRREQQAVQRERAAALAHEKRLAALAGRQDQAWHQVDNLIETRKPADYDAAIALLQDLGEICRRDGRAETYEQHMEQLRETHRRKTTFIERLDRAASS